MLIAGALVFNYVVTIENIPNSLAQFMGGFELSSDRVSAARQHRSCWSSAACSRARTILLVIVPIFIPTAKALGIDLVHFGVVVVVNIMIGLLTPPYGLLLFVLANMTKQPLGAIVREAAPFILVGDRRARAHHLRARTRALAAAHLRLQGITDSESTCKPIYVLNGPTSTASASASRRSTARPRSPRSRAMCRRQPGRPSSSGRSNSEAQLVDWIHEAIDTAAGIVINPAGLHLHLDRDPRRAEDVSRADHRAPHLQHPPARALYHHSLVSKVATAVIAGLGPDGYRTATQAMLRLLS